MCGRFSLRALLDDLTRHLQREYHIENIADDLWKPRYNVAPGQPVIAVLHDGQKNRVGKIKWGFLPSYAPTKIAPTGIINAKAETVAENPVFRNSLAHKRCVVLADGFYEWKKGESGKTPMRILMADESIFPMAGIWNVFTQSDGTKISTCTILTTQANGIVSSIHDRMPVILTSENEKIWLDPSVTDGRILRDLLVPFDPRKMQAYPVSTLVNSVLNDSPECIRPV